MAQDTLPQRRRLPPIRSVKVVVAKGPDAGGKRDAADELISVGTAADNQLVLTDPTVSRYHLEIARRGDRLHVKDLGSTNGVVASGLWLEEALVPPGTVLNLGNTTLRVEDGGTFEHEEPEAPEISTLRGSSPAMVELSMRIDRVARADTSVLLVGETGVGKEVAARAIHQASGRAEGPFETVDCGAISPTLIASELFGHVKGAFTGADEERAGAFERAKGGTLFLDEIGELPLALQPMLLGAVERRSIRRVGGAQSIPLDVRVISATHRDLRTAVNNNEFREDLYYRLAVVALQIPPLRERLKDIPVLVEHFLRLAGHNGPLEELVPDAVMQSLMRHRWPGNVRELRNFVEAFLVLGEPLPSVGARAKGPGDNEILPASTLESLLTLPYREARAKLLDTFEHDYLERMLQVSGNNISEAARKARIHRSYITVMLQKHRLR